MGGLVNALGGLAEARRVSLSPTSLGDEARLFLREEELDAALELFLLAESALRASAESALDGQPAGLGRGHYRAAFLLKRRPGLGVQELARLTGLSKQAASRALRDLEGAGYVARGLAELDARRRPPGSAPLGGAAHLVRPGRG